MKLNEKMVYTNENGESIEISPFSIYTPTNIEQHLENEITTNKNNIQDGETYISSTLGPRTINIDGEFRLSRESNFIERNLKKVFNPTLKGTLRHYTGDFERLIDVGIEGIPSISKHGMTATFSIDLVAHFPYWTEEERTEYIALLTPALKFPLVIPKDRGIIFGKKKAILETEILNVGDTESGFRVIFKARGMVSNPCVINSLTGEKIRIKYDMEKGDTIETINQPNKKQIYINGVKSFKNLDRLNADFFKLGVGKNLIGYQADTNVINLDVVLYYSPLYL